MNLAYHFISFICGATLRSKHIVSVGFAFTWPITRKRVDFIWPMMTTQ